jgi:outer membrane immunogenic protein
MRYKIASLAAAAIAFGGVQGASAADMAVKARPIAPVAAAYSWDGCYVGANAGYVRSTSSTQLTGTDTDGGGFGSELADGSTPSSFDTRFNGFIGGGQVGCNRTFGGFVWGVEVDADWSGASKTLSQVNLPQPPFPPRAAITTTISNKLDWLGTARLRVGLPIMNTVLLYATGGLAFGETEVSASSVCPTCGPPRNAASTSSKTALGWTIGGGAEWAIVTNWSVKAEALYYDLGNNSTGLVYTYGANTSSLTATNRERGWLARAGLNFHF